MTFRSFLFPYRFRCLIIRITLQISVSLFTTFFSFNIKIIRLPTQGNRMKNEFNS
jgi:hypothetical protein